MYIKRLMVAGLALAASGCSTGMDGITSQVVDDANRSSVRVRSLFSDGHGTIISRNPTLVLTASHVGSISPIETVSGQGSFSGASVAYRRQLEWSDIIPNAPIDQPDIMVLQAEGMSGGDQAELATAAEGDRVFAFAPFGGRSGGTVAHPTIEHNGHEWGLADMAVWPGMSGSGLYRASDGACVGVIVAATRHGALFVPSSTAMKVCGDSIPSRDVATADAPGSQDRFASASDEQ